ncbi:MAG TPA: helix-turn-helix domain-containing protein [Acidimicrobiales bacterium]|nr:helix-turn-helix domain-containing protein [Acidimicrobiales bacterium]
MNTLATSSVVLIRWPDEADELDGLRMRRIPRLLLVAENESPPTDGDPFQDWIRLPATDSDLHARIRALELRAQATPDAPEMPGDGRLRYLGRWVEVSPIGERMLQALVAGFEEVVSAAEMQAAAWPTGGGSAGALRIHILRIRQALEPLGLELKVVRDRGYVLQPTPSQQSGSPSPAR